MRWLNTLTMRLRSLFRRSRVEDELDAELQFHLEQQIDENRAAGMSVEEARAAALRGMGSVTLIKEQAREALGVKLIDDLRQDVRYAWRGLLKNPGFTFVAVLTLALGIGANTAMFSFADATAFRPPDVPRPSELVRIFSSAKDLEYGRLSYPDYVDVRQRTTTFAGTVAYDTAFVPLSRERADVPQLFGAWLVSPNFFSVLEVQPTLGRGFHEDDGRVGASPVAVISHRLWQRYFSFNPAVVGTQITLGSSEFTIVGVAPPGFGGTELYFHPDLYVPIAMARSVEVNIPAAFLDDRGDRWLTVLGRLKPGVRAREASAELAALARSLEQTYPQTNRNRTALALPEVTARGRLDAGGYQGAALMLALVGFVLLIACATIANLLLSRAASRRKEIAMRLALGASRGRLVRQFLTESVLLSMMGGIVGLLFAYWGVTYVAGIARSIMSATDLPLALDVRLDQRVLLFTTAVSLATGVIFGLAPALHSTRVDLIPALKTHISTTGLLRRWFSVRHALIAAQVALSVVVLTVAGLAVRGVADKQRIDPGFRTDHVLAMTFNPSLIKYDQSQTRRYYHELAERTKGLPGVQAVGLAQFIPLAANWGSISLAVDGYEMPPGQDQVTIRNSVVDAGYWRAMGTPIVRGRAFDDRDTLSNPRVAIINETMAKRYWPTQDALGKTLRLRDGTGLPVQVVGIAKDGKYGEIAEPYQPFVFLPFSQHFRSMMTMVVRSHSDAAALAASIRGEVQAVGAGVPTFDVRTLDQIFESRQMLPARLTSQMFVALGLLGLLLAVVGLYGVMSFLTTQRTREIGIRIAIGASRWSVLSLVLGQAVGVVGLGVGVGIGLALGLTPSLAGPFDFRPRDTLVLGVTLLVLVMATLVATLIPGHRATRVDPLIALRSE